MRIRGINVASAAERRKTLATAARSASATARSRKQGRGYRIARYVSHVVAKDSFAAARLIATTEIDPRPSAVARVLCRSAAEEGMVA